MAHYQTGPGSFKIRSNSTRMRFKITTQNGTASNTFFLACAPGTEDPTTGFMDLFFVVPVKC